MNKQIIANFPVAQPATMPEPAQTVFLGLTAIVSVIAIVAAFKASRRSQSSMPLLMVASGFFAVAMEPLVAFFGHIVHPAVGQISIFEAMTRSIPWHMALGYTAGFGLFYVWIYSKVTNGTLTNGVFWRGILLAIACYWFGEIVPVHQGLWIYYDHQPLWIWRGSSPLTWSVLNTACMVTGATLMFLARPYLRGAAQLLILPFGVIGVVMGHMGAGLPMYFAMNTDLPTWVIELSGVISVVFALMIIWLSGILLNRGDVLQPDSRYTGVQRLA